MAIITIINPNIKNNTLNCSFGDLLLNILQKNDLKIESPCGGAGTCGKCKVKVLNQNEKNISKPTVEELNYLSKDELNAGIRLSCLTTVYGDLTIDLLKDANISNNEESSSHKILAEGYIPNFDYNPNIIKISCPLSKNTLKLMDIDYLKNKNIKTFENVLLNLIKEYLIDNSSNIKKLNKTNKTNKKILNNDINNLNFTVNLNDLQLMASIQKLSEILSNNLFDDQKIYVDAIFSENELLGIEIRGNNSNTSNTSNNSNNLTNTFENSKYYGIAIDIGTTTLVASLIDITTGNELCSESRINPQKQYGLDVLSRIDFAKKNDNGLKLLHNSIIDCINEMIAELSKKQGISNELIYEIAISANTTMLHFLLNIDAKTIGKSPYLPIFLNSKYLKSSDLNINISKFGRVYCLPGVSGYIGSDIVAGVEVSNLGNTDKLVLFIDIGTNGEIVLSNKGKLSACSCAAGPALEGMNISCGMRAANGAIEGFKIKEDNSTPEINVIGNSEPLGICGSGILDIISEINKAGLINKTGRIKSPNMVNELYKDMILEKDGKRAILIYNSKNKDSKEIYISQNDIRQVQLAKAAIVSGFEALLAELSVSMQDLDEVIIAGQFGKHLSEESLAGSGIIPKELKNKVRYIGNSSKIGALMCLLSKESRKNMENVANKIEYCELSTKEGYEDLFIKALNFNK
ncbi:ASKHA domain-containing protein [Methanococcus voltae]|uniref:Ferredoxin n=1 Tax=Methanococcus voltae (strain ATCC BAA-1334 / A3) TaxID=456320 RepID=D7DQV6_METV3|nr:ASKHA domain-containing protein [Methanococcus voltae]MCS3900893.1 uncharacterized 2Fe-2S/4Fe-4S cluster protein (DUF4445 family) [Methanococcus voltae]